jgi:hypothetical protein
MLEAAESTISCLLQTNAMHFHNRTSEVSLLDAKSACTVAFVCSRSICRRSIWVPEATGRSRCSVNEPSSMLVPSFAAVEVVQLQQLLQMFSRSTMPRCDVGTCFCRRDASVCCVASVTTNCSRSSSVGLGSALLPHCRLRLLSIAQQPPFRCCPAAEAVVARYVRYRALSAASQTMQTATGGGGRGRRCSFNDGRMQAMLHSSVAPATTALF